VSDMTLWVNAIMQHRCAAAEDGSLAGAWWIDDNNRERRFCSWTYDIVTGEMYVSRGMVTRPWRLPAAELRSLDDLSNRLPKVALYIASQIRV
jgi:hypothetical protein